MASRSNAISELTRLWLEQRHGCVVRESLPVPVTRALSDIDLIALRPDGLQFKIPNGAEIGPRVIVETKDEHDWDASGKEFGKFLEADLSKFSLEGYTPADAKDVKFTMLREQHFRRAERFLGSADFDRLFVVHAIDARVLERLLPRLTAARIHWITIRDVVLDLTVWYDSHTRRAELRHDLVGDLFHLLVGFCGCRPQPSTWGRT